MASRDPEALKRAISLASQTVAQVRSRHLQVISGSEVMKGGGLSDSHEAPADLEESEQERHYNLFHERATARKLSLASRGLEVENIFIADLYDIAEVMHKGGERKAGDEMGESRENGWTTYVCSRGESGIGKREKVCALGERALSVVTKEARLGGKCRHKPPFPLPVCAA